MEIKLTENERQQLKKAYECLYHLNKNMIDLEDFLKNVGWPFAGISPEDYQSKARFIPAKTFADLPFTEKMSLLYFLIRYTYNYYGDLLEESILRDSDD